MNQTHSFQVLAMLVTCLFITMVSRHEVQAQDKSKSDVLSARVLPVSTVVSESIHKRFIKNPRTSVNWENTEYSINDGIEVLMSVITDPNTDVTTRARAINRLSHFSTSLQNRECLQKLCALYDRLESRMEKKEVLTCLTVAEDSTGLNLLYRVASTEPDPIVRLRAASGLATWNIREGVHQLIELFQSSVETGLRQVGAAAMITFTNLNERKEWHCPQDEIRKTALAIAGDNREEYAIAAMKGYRDWFEANKERFPDWKPGDPLPESPPIESTHSP